MRWSISASGWCIAPSFGDIFASNAVNNGLLPARLPEEQIEALIARLGDGAAVMTVDLTDGVIRIGNEVIPFDLDPIWRLKLINGWDDIDMTRQPRHRDRGLPQRKGETAPPMPCCRRRLERPARA